MSEVQVASQSDVVPLGQIEEELTRVLVAYQGPGDTVTVRRARMSNLVIFVEDAKRVAEIQETIPNIVAVHPARVILAVHEFSDQEAPIQGSVNAWCSLTGGKQHICSEQVTLHSKGRTGDHLVYAIRGLLSGDLPTNLWWTSLTPPALAGPAFNEAAQNVQQIIYDSNGWLDPPRGVAASGTWIASIERDDAGNGRDQSQQPRPDHGWRVASDVNWRRLKFWRRLVTQALDPNSVPGALDTISEVQIEHGPHAVVQSWLLVSWLASRLHWEVDQGRIQPGVEISWQVRAPHGLLRVRIDRLPQGPSEIRALRIRCVIDKKPVTLRFEAVEEERLSVTQEGLDTAPRTVTVQPQKLDDLIARQLSDRERDPVFRDSMALAATFARSVQR